LQKFPRYEEVQMQVERLENGATTPDVFAGHLHLRKVAEHANGLIAEARYPKEMAYSNLEAVHPKFKILRMNSNPEGHDYKILVYYPKSTAVPAFVKSAKYLHSIGKGPLAYVFPGALGVIHAHVEKIEKTGNCHWTLDQLHGCFIRKKEAGVGYTKYKPHRLWKETLLNHFFEQLADTTSEVRLKLKHMVQQSNSGHEEEVGPGNIEAFRKIALQHGFETLPHSDKDRYVRAIRITN